jgi:dolichol-phosphate mannosyltransferase
MKIIAVIATYNERENLGTLIPKVLALRDDIEVLVVDDASPDGTGEVAEELKVKTGRVDVIHRSGKMGLGLALKAGLEEAIKKGADNVVTMDADHSHAPEHLPAMLEQAKNFPVVVGSRYVPGGGVRNWGISRKILSRIANTYARFITGLPVRDCTSGYRVYNCEALEKINVDQAASAGYSFLVEMLLLAHRSGFRIAEVPIIFTDRIMGHSKINAGEIMGGAWNLFKSRLRI